MPNNSGLKDGLSNHEKTTLVDELGLSRNYSYFELLLMDMGLGWILNLYERVRLLYVINKNPAMKAFPSNDASEDDFPLMSEGLDYE